MSGKGHYSFKELELVGYATTVFFNQCPRIVPPIFQYTEVEDTYLYPPFDYTTDAHGVVGGTIVNQRQLHEFCRQGRGTLLVHQSAKPGHLLVKREDEVWYTMHGNALSWLTAYSEGQAVSAYYYFLSKSYGCAAHCAKRSLNANDSNLTAMEVLGATYWTYKRYNKTHSLIEEAADIDESVDLKQRIKRLIHERDGTKEKLSDPQERMLKRLFGRRIPAWQLKTNTLQSLERKGFVEVIDKIAGLSWRGEERMKPDLKQLEGFR